MLQESGWTLCSNLLPSGVVLKNEVGERLDIEVSKKCNLARILHSVRKKVGERRSPTFPPPHYTTASTALLVFGRSLTVTAS